MVYCLYIRCTYLTVGYKHVFISPVSSPKSCVIGPGMGLGQENHDGEDEPVITVAPPSSQRAFCNLPSVDSAVESWDGSNLDGSFTSPGGLTSLISNFEKVSFLQKLMLFCIFTCSSNFSVSSIRFSWVAQCKDNKQPVLFLHPPEGQSTFRSGA